MDAIAALLPTVEIAMFCLGSFVWLRSHVNPYPVAAALALGIVSGLGLLSLLFQVGFLAGLPEAIPILEGVTLAGLIWLNRRHWGGVHDIHKRVVSVWREMPVTIAVFAIAAIYLFLQAYLLPPSSWDALTYHLPRVLLWEQNRSLFLRDYTIAPQAAFPVGSDILFYAFLRWRLDYGLGLFSWLSYLVILLGTYAISRPRVSRAIALTTAIVIVCLPEIVYQSTGTKNDIMLAAVSLACVVWADRWLRVPSIESLLGLGLTLCFGVAVKTSFVLFACFFVLLWCVLVIQRGQLVTLLGIIVKQWRIVILCLVPGLVMSQYWLFMDNYRQFGEWLGPAAFALANQNNDGLFGGVANLVRYSLQSMHLLQPVDAWGERLFGGSLTSGLQSIYDTVFEPLFRNAGRAQQALDRPFEIKWQPQEDTSWFGPVSVFLVFPAVTWCVVRGRGLARVMASVAIGVVLVMSYKLGWSPWKARFFSLVFVCTGICVATFLQQLRVKELRLNGWRWLSLVILVYACLYNFSKPVIPSPSYLSRENIWTRSDWTRDRQVYDYLYHGNQIESLSQAIASAQRVAIVGYAHYFSLIFDNPDIEFVLLRIEDDFEETHSLVEIEDRLMEADHLICFEKRCNPANLSIDLDLLWENDVDAQVPAVYKVESLSSSVAPTICSTICSKPDIGISLNNLAVLPQQSGKPNPAKDLLTRASSIFEKTLGADHPNTRLYRENAAS